MFDYFISLGDACHIASSMEKYGLRSCSSPFDWLYTPDFKWVLYHIDTDFKDFLLQENLESYDEEPLHFLEKQSSIKFIHEKHSFEYEYDILKSKYTRRIDKFLEMEKRKICYLRNIVNKEYLDYIISNVDYIQSIISKHNPDSEIVFLFDRTLDIPENFPFRYYKMKKNGSSASRNALRSYFDGADDFLSFCGENYSGVNIIKNLSYDLAKEQSLNNLLQRRYTTLTALIRHNFQKDIFPNEIIIYGAGAIGIALYQRIKNLTKVKYFIDANKAGTEFDGIKIISVNELQYEEGAKIVVSASYDFQNIKNILSAKYNDEDIISLDDILNLTF